jgi:hypothetical protein
MTKQTPQTQRKLATESFPQTRELECTRVRGQARPPSPSRGVDINAQLAQARELEAKLAEEYRTVRLFRSSITGEASARSERARELGK